MKKIWILCFILLLSAPVLLLAAETKKDIDPWFVEMRQPEKPYINPVVRFTGVEGEKPVYDGDLVLTKAEVEKIRKMKLTAVYVDNNLAGEYSMAIHKGAIDTFKYLGIKVLAETMANFDPAKQKADVESVMALNPDIVVGYAVDPTTGTEVFQPVVKAKKILVLVSNRPKGYNPGKEYVGISTNNPYDNAYVCAMDMIKYVGDGGIVGIITFKEDYFVLNVMDDAVKDALNEHGSNLTVYEEGYVDWNGVGEIATAMVQKHPDIQAIYTTWFDPAMVAVQDLKGIGRSDIKIFTFGMNTPALVDLLDPDGMIKSLTTDFTWNVGLNTATLAAYGVLKKKAPEMVVVPTTTVTPDNLRDLWKIVYRGLPLPKEVDDALKRLGK